MANYCYFNGKITTLDKAKISPYDLGMLRGYGVFDVMRTQGGKPFLLDEHWARLENSAKELKLKIPVTKSEFVEILRKLLKLNGFKVSGIRTVLTGGMANDGFSPCGRETFYILIEKFQAVPNACYEKGVGVMTLNYKRNIPWVKVTNYVEAIRHIDARKKLGALEITYIHQSGRLLENSLSNIFMFKGDVLMTPKDGVLLGTTRNLVVKLAKKKFKVKVKKVSEKEFRSAAEIFLTGTNKDIVPVVKVDGKKVGNGKVGKNTKILMQMFKEFAEKY